MRMSHHEKTRRKVFGAGIGVISLVAGLVVAFMAIGSASGSVAATTTTTTATTTAQKPDNTSPPTISGTPQEGQVLTGDKGTWSNRPTDFNYFWVRCDKNGGSCSNISGAHAATYTLTSADVGNTIRFKVEATNSAGSTFASSVPSAVVRKAAAPPPPPPPAPATGCPAGNGPANVNDVKTPARLIIDAQQAQPSVVRPGTQQIVLRYHVSDTCGQSVVGALVYVTAVPFGQLSIPPEQATGNDGWAQLSLRTLAGFPVSRHQQLIALFVRARKSGENLLAGISTRRLFSLRVNLH
jgi:hypothetical protein